MKKLDVLLAIIKTSFCYYLINNFKTEIIMFCGVLPNTEYRALTNWKKHESTALIDQSEHRKEKI